MINGTRRNRVGSKSRLQTRSIHSERRVVGNVTSPLGPDDKLLYEAWR